MIKKVKVEVSNRHIHLTEETYNKLFDTPLEKKRDLSQKNEFASNQTLTLKTQTDVIENVRIVGPFRNYNQVEIAFSDARKLGINPSICKSGEFNGAETITLCSEKNEVTLENCCILAERHLHIDKKTAKLWGVEDKDIIKVLVRGKKYTILFANVKVSDNGVLRLHIDIDDANANLLKQDDEVEIII